MSEFFTEEEVMARANAFLRTLNMSVSKALSGYTAGGKHFTTIHDLEQWLRDHLQVPEALRLTPGAPYLTEATLVADSDTEVTASVTVYQRYPVYYILTEESDVPTVEQITGGVDANDDAAIASGVVQTPVIGVVEFDQVAELTAETTYYAFFVQVDPNGTASEIVSASTETPAAPEE